MKELAGLFEAWTLILQCLAVDCAMQLCPLHLRPTGQSYGQLVHKGSSDS